MNKKKQRQKNKQIKRLEKDILRGKIDLSILDNSIIELPRIKQAIETTQKPKNKTKIRKSQLSKLKKSSSFDLIKENDNQLSFSRKKQRKKKRKQKKAKTYKVKQGARVATTQDEVDEKHPSISEDTVADSPLIAIQRVRDLCETYSDEFIKGNNARFFLSYFNSTILYYGDEEVGNALLSMRDDYIEGVQLIIFESKQDISQKMTYHFIDMLVELSGNSEDFWYIQELVDDNFGQEYE